MENFKKLKYFDILNKCLGYHQELDNINMMIESIKKELDYVKKVQYHIYLDFLTKIKYDSIGIKNPIKYNNDKWKILLVKTEKIMDFFMSIDQSLYKDEIRIAWNLYRKIKNF